MAGAVAATSTGHASVYYNPARLTFQADPSFTIGVSQGSFALTIDDSDVDVRSAPALTLGLAIPLPFLGWLEDRIALGLGLVMPQTSILIADIPAPTTARFALLETRAQTVSIQAGVGLRPLPWVAIGAGAIALAALEGRVEVGPNETGRLGSQVSDTLVADFAPVVGLAFEPLAWLSLAATYRGESKATFTFPIKAELGDLASQVGLGGLDVDVLPIPLLAIEGTAQFDPEQVSFEVAARPIPEMLIAVSGAWKHWSRFENPIVYTAERPGDAPQPPPDFSDTWIARLGFEGELLVGPMGLQPRAGVAWEPSPTPPQEGFHNYLDNDRVIVGLGLGLTLRFLQLDLAFQFHHLAPRRVAKDSALSEEHPGWPTITHAGEIYYLGAELGVTL